MENSLRLQLLHKCSPLFSILEVLSPSFFPHHLGMFPYYTFNILAGLDQNGKGGVYSYDAIGSFERSTHACQGSGQPLIQPLLDNRIGLRNQVFKSPEDKPSYTAGDIVKFVKVALTSAAERDIYTGDSAEIFIFESGQEVVTDSVQLRSD